MAKSKAGKIKKSKVERSGGRGNASEVLADMRGLKCPFPALKAKKILSRMVAGEVLVVECTDPLASIDIPNLIRETGDTIEGSSKKGRLLTFRIRKT